MDTPARGRPNFLFICCDHLRGDWLGCNGHPLVQTPQIDKFAHAGVNFRNAFSECPVCIPARRIMMTGMDTYGIHMNYNREQPFPEGPKLAELLTRAGWQTFASGKLHTNPQRNRIGFEDVALNEEGRRHGGLLRDDYETFLAEQGMEHLLWSHGLGNNQYGLRLSPLPENLTSTHWTAQRAMEFIERRDPTRPFFLHVSFDKPHPPIVPPASYYELYRDASFPSPVMGDWVENKLPSQIRHLRYANNYGELLRQPAVVQQSLRGFAAMITHIDSAIGQLLGTLRENGLVNDTWIIFTSDHGDQLFDHGNFAKGDFFRGSANVPFIVTPPASWRREKGTACGRGDMKTPVALKDIFPTVLDAAGLPVPENVTGKSLVPLILDDNAEFRKVTLGNCGVVYGGNDGETKYQWFSDDNLEFLFDVQNDPGECHDLSGNASSRETLETWRSRLYEWLKANNDPHAVDGRLKPIAHDWMLQQKDAFNLWNNRGRH